MVNESKDGEKQAIGILLTYTVDHKCMVWEEWIPLFQFRIYETQYLNSQQLLKSLHVNEVAYYLLCLFHTVLLNKNLLKVGTFLLKLLIDGKGKNGVFGVFFPHWYFHFFIFNILEVLFIIIVFLYNCSCSAHVHIHIHTFSSIDASEQSEFRQCNIIYSSLFFSNSSVFKEPIRLPFAKPGYLVSIYYMSRSSNLAWVCCSAFTILQLIFKTLVGRT